MLNIENNPLDEKTTKLIKKIFKKTLKLDKHKARQIEATLSFVTDEEIKELNKETRNIDEITDVLSFPNLNHVFNGRINKKLYPLDINPATDKIVLGDIIINLNRAKEQAKEYAHSFNREVCYLFVHGLLHLLSYDHIDEMDKNLMRGQEELILSKFDLTRS
jgi:probable rRNA maturation factor